jgi:SAM domain (Sterile alpha motif)
MRGNPPVTDASMDVVVWLRSLGLGKYEAIFRENDIDETVLPSLTHENLKELGVASFWSSCEAPRCHRCSA